VFLLRWREPAWHRHRGTVRADRSVDPDYTRWTSLLHRGEKLGFSGLHRDRADPREFPHRYPSAVFTCQRSNYPNLQISPYLEEGVGARCARPLSQFSAFVLNRIVDSFYFLHYVGITDQPEAT